MASCTNTRIRRATNPLATATGTDSPPLLDIRRKALLFLALAFTYCYFFDGSGWNQNSRFDLVRAIVERGTFEITAYHRNTGDKSRIGRKYYSDKAPGHAFSAVPPVALARSVMQAAGKSTRSHRQVQWLHYVASISTSALAGCLLVLAALWLARRLGASEGGALFAAGALGLASPILVYATMFWGHNLAAACVMGAFCAAWALRSPGGSRRSALLGLAVGLAGGWATVTEYPAAVSAATISFLALWHTFQANRKRLLPVAAGIAVGAVVTASVLMMYNSSVFGSPFRIGYQAQVNFASVDKLFGWPDGTNLLRSMFDDWRGLFPLAPVLLLAPVGLVPLLRDRTTRAGAGVMAFLIVYYFLMNASYEGWYGGWCYGPRNVISSLAFMAVPLAIAWTRGNRAMRIALALLATWGALMGLVAASTASLAPEPIRHPITDLWWSSFLDGKLALDPLAWNLGMRVGLTGHASLIPLVLVWVAAAVLWWKLPRPAPAKPGSEDAAAAPGSADDASGDDASADDASAEVTPGSDETPAA